MIQPSRPFIHWKGRRLLNCSLLFFLFGKCVSAEKASRLPFSIMRGTSEKKDGISSPPSTTKNEKNRMTLLRFGGYVACTTQPLPFPHGKKTISKFFSCEKFRNELLGGSVEEMGEPSPELLEKWSEEASLAGAAAPLKKDRVIRLVTPGFYTPGVKIIPTTIFGTTLILPSLFKRRVSTYAERQFLMIGTEYKAEGVKALVSLFHRMMGTDQKNKNHKLSSSSTHLFSRVYVEPANNDKGDIIFKSNVRLEVEVKFPSFLLRIIPMSAKRVEKMNSGILQKLLEKDAPASLERYREAYIKWVAS